MPQHDPTAGTRGRPRSEQARAAVLDTAARLTADIGFGALTIDAVAAEGGVSKATVYRWWPNKAAIVMDAFLARTEPQIAFDARGSLVQQLRRQLTAAVRALVGTPLGTILRGLIAESQYDAELAAALRTRFIDHRRRDARETLLRGIERGELAADTDPETVIDLLYGALYYRILISGDPVTTGYVDALLRQLLPTV